MTHLPKRTTGELVLKGINLNSRIVWAFSVAAVVYLGFSLLQPVMGARDCDSYAFLWGAHDFRAGLAYETPNHESLIHFPPAYAYLLSFFSRPLEGAVFLNYGAAALASGFFYLLLIETAWAPPVAATFVLAIAFNFFRVLASCSKPDMLCYFFFLSGVWFYRRSHSTLRTVGYFLLASTLALKYSALIIVPAAILAERFEENRKTQMPLKFGFCLWGLLALVIFGTSAIYFHSPRIPGYDERIPGILYYLKVFLVSIPRAFFSGWYGSLRNPWAVVLAGSTLSVGVFCLSSLRVKRELPTLFYFGVILFVLSWIPCLFFHTETSVRILGYPLLLLILGFSPDSRPRWWIVYALCSLVAAWVNLQMNDASGFNHPRYQKLGRDTRALPLPSAEIYTNSYRILDIQANVSSHPVTSLGEVPDDSLFVWINLPNYDAIASVITPMPRPGAGWCVLYQVEGAEVFEPCDSNLLALKQRAR